MNESIQNHFNKNRYRCHEKDGDHQRDSQRCSQVQPMRGMAYGGVRERSSNAVNSHSRCGIIFIDQSENSEPGTSSRLLPAVVSQPFQNGR